MKQIQGNNNAREDLRFENFNVQDAYKKCKEDIENDNIISNEIAKEVIDELREEGFDVIVSFCDNLWDAEHYRPDDQLVRIYRDGKEMSLVVVGSPDYDIFLFELFIKDVKEKYPNEGAILEKIILFEGMEGDGKDLFDAFDKCSKTGKTNISEKFKRFKGFESILEEFLSTKKYIYRLDRHYNPRELTISKYLGMLDMYATANLYYAYELPDGKLFVDNELIAGYSIGTALLEARSFFKDFNHFLDLYEKDELDGYCMI
jgi:hypothetical protein